MYREKQPPEVFYKKGVLGNFAKFTGKHMCRSFFLNSAAGLRPATLLKKGLLHRCFIVNFAKFLRTLFLQNTSERLFLIKMPEAHDKKLKFNQEYKSMKIPFVFSAKKETLLEKIHT